MRQNFHILKDLAPKYIFIVACLNEDLSKAVYYTSL